MRVQVIMETLTDWSVGAGHGQPGGADRLVVRDSEGLPFVPARTFRGLLRDAAEEAAAALDDDRGTAWQDMVATLFGPRLTGRGAVRDGRAPSASFVRVGALQMAAELRTALLDPELGPARRSVLTAIRPAVRIDAATGTADDRHLRFGEVVRAGLQLTGEIDIDDSLPPDATDAVLAVLALAARGTRHVGGGRRRGRGRVDCRLDPTPTSDEVRAIVGATPPTLERSRRASAASVALTSVEDRRGPCERIHVAITALEPLVLSPETRGNVVATAVEVPGRALLPLVSDALAGHVDVRAALRAGMLSVGPGRVRIDDAPTVPIPLCLAWPKVAAGSSRSARNQAAPSTADEARDGTQYRAAKAGEYVAVAMNSAAPQLTVVVVDTGLATHNVIDPLYQRPDEDAGGVYAYETVLPGTSFVAELRLSPELAGQIGDRLRSQLPGEHRIGAMRNAGYGRVALQVLSSTPVMAATASIPAGSPFLVLADGPVICGGESWPLAPTEAAWRATLRRALIVAGGDEELQLEAAPIDGRAVWLRQQAEHSWHARWGLPRPGVASICGGSVIRLVATHTLPAEVVASVADAGIGARTAEGYGRLRFQPPELVPRSVMLRDFRADERDRSRRSALQSADGTAALDRRAAGLLDELDRLAARDQILAAALSRARQPDFASALGWSGTSMPSRSQLSSLRAAASVTSGARESVGDWVRHVREVEGRRDHHERSRRWSETQLEAIEQQVARLPGSLAEELPTAIARPLLDDQDLQDVVVAAVFIEAIRVLGRAVRPAQVDTGSTRADGGAS